MISCNCTSLHIYAYSSHKTATTYSHLRRTRVQILGHYSLLGSVTLYTELYLSPNIVRVIKSRRMRWAGYVVRMEETRGVYRVLAGKPEGKRPLGRSRSRWDDNFKADDLLHLSVVYMPLCMLTCVLFCTANKLYLLHWYVFVCACVHIQGVPGGMCETSEECSLGQTIPI
jgi:hypothetical protein